MKPQVSNAEVVVVGGGISGLAAAHALAKAGRDVVLLEARDRLGGRINTVRRKGWPGPIELGAQFVHGGNADLWRLLKASGTRVSKVPNLHWQSLGQKISKIRDLDKRIGMVTGLIKERDAGNLSFSEYFKAHPAAIQPDDWRLAQSFVEGFEAAPMGKISARSLAGEALDEEEQFMVPDGYDQVIGYLVSECLRLGVRILKSAVVKSVAWSSHHVAAKTRSGLHISARAAVVTLPLGVLQSRSGMGAVSFRPALKSKISAISGMEMGRVVRIAMHFTDSGWSRILPLVLRRQGRRPFGFIHSSVKGLPVWWSLSPGPVLVGWAGGPDATALKRLSRSQRKGRALLSLASLLKLPVAEVRRALAASEEWDWINDPFSRGAYSFIAAGHDDGPRKLAKPLSGTIYFAGEATADGSEVGTVHGALRSGLRAASEFLATKSRRPRAS